MDETVTMYRPTGPEELALVRQADFRAWPPRLPGQPIFYPVTNLEYATRIAREWNVPESGYGCVTRFAVRAAFARRYAIHVAGDRACAEWWIPASDLAELNRNLVGRIEVVAEFHRAQAVADG